MSLVPLLLTALLCAPPLAPDVAGELERYFSHCHASGMFNGNVLLKRGDEVLYERAWGLADLRDGRPLDLDTAFYLASVSKQFTSLAALLLVDDGALELDARLVEILPAFEGFADEVTVRQLMTHTSGIPDHYRLLNAAPPGLTNERVEQLLLEHGQLDFPPGSAYRYSNGGYVLLARVIEQASGQTLGSLLEERVFGPLDMTRSQVFDETTEAVSNRAVGFAGDGSPDDYHLFTTGAGGMFTTVRDLARWDDALAADRLVSPELMAQAYTPATLSDGSVTGYGFGWVLHNGGRKVSHTGGLAGFATLIFRDRQTHDTLIVLCNQGAAAPDLYDMVEAAGAALRGGPVPLPRIPIDRVLRGLIAEDGTDAALARYDEILASETERYDLREGFLNQLGYEYIAAGELERARAVLEKNRDVFPQSGNTWDSLGEVQALQGQREAALASYARSLELDPDNANAVTRMADLRAEG